MTSAPPGVRNLLRAAMVIFVITVVIGILNGTDLWDPPRNTLLTHVHSGTLGWITLSVFAGSIWMFDGEGKHDAGPLPTFAIIAIALYVLAFWSGDLFNTVESIQRPIGGTLAFIAMAWMFVWVLKSKRGAKWNVAEFGMGLALAFLVFGAVLGVLLGLQLADVEIVSPENASRLGSSHPGSMVVGFVVLAGLALIEWLMPGRRIPMLSESRSGMIQMLLLFAAGLIFVGGELIGNEELLQLAVPLQVVGALILLFRFRRELAPSQWGGVVVNRYVRTSVLGFVVVVVLIAYLIGQIIALGEAPTEENFADLLPVVVAMNHINFIMVMTNLILAMMILSTASRESTAKLIYWGVNVGVVGFVIGLITESAELKRVFTPILGLALLYAIYTYFTADPAPQPESAMAEM